MESKRVWENAYCKFGENLPWCIEEIPGFFKRIVRSKWVNPCKTLDIGAGVGNYAAYLAKQGFDVTAIDLSRKAISIAKQKYANEKNLKFKVVDFFRLGNKKFDFIYEISILHNIHPKKRAEYARKVYSHLNSVGKFLVCCFSQGDWMFHGKKEHYSQELDHTVYPLSAQEIRSIFEKYFIIENLRKVYLGRKNKRKRERFLCLMTKREKIQSS